MLIEDTGLAEWGATGEGVVTFTNPAEAIQGIERINADYARHRLAARRLADEVFATDQVLPALLDAALS